jgi:hypothetical protein
VAYDVVRSFKQAIDELHLRDWHNVTRHFQDGNVEQWQAAKLTSLVNGLGKPVHAICAAADRCTLLALLAEYLTTNLSREALPLADALHLYRLSHWNEKDYAQMKDDLSWAHGRQRQGDSPSLGNGML